MELPPGCAGASRDAAYMSGHPCCGGLFGDALTLGKINPINALNDQIGLGGNWFFGL